MSAKKTSPSLKVNVATSPVPPLYQCWAGSIRECAGLRKKLRFLRDLAGTVSNLEIGGHGGGSRDSSLRATKAKFFSQTPESMYTYFSSFGVPGRPPTSKFARLQASCCSASL